MIKAFRPSLTEQKVAGEAMSMEMAVLNDIAQKEERSEDEFNREAQ